MAKQIKTFEDFQSQLVNNKDLQDEFKTDPVKAIKKFESSPLLTDKWIYRIIVLALGVTIISIIIGVLILMGFDKISKDTTVPTILTAIGSAAIGALAGLLAPHPNSKQ